MYLEDLNGPTATDLAAIDAEWPLIAAELDALDAEIALIVAADSGGPTELDWRRHRRAAARLTNVLSSLMPVHVCRDHLLDEVGITECGYGCTVMRCRTCGGERVSHRAVYGCPTARTAV